MKGAIRKLHYLKGDGGGDSKYILMIMHSNKIIF